MKSTGRRQRTGVDILSVMACHESACGLAGTCLLVGEDLTLRHQQLLELLRVQVGLALRVQGLKGLGAERGVENGSA